MNELMFKVKKRSFLYFILWLCSLALNACSSDDESIPEEPPVNEQPSVNPSKAIKVVTSIADNILSGNTNTRTAYKLETDKLKFAWEQGDRIGIYPSAGTQIAFSIKSGTGQNSATFDGGAWILSQEETYAAYYPYDESNPEDRTALRFSYEGQSQTGNASMAHLGTHDLMATGATQALNEELNFQFKHLNCVAQMKLTVPIAATFNKLVIRCNEEAIFTKTANLDLSGIGYTYSSNEMTHQLEMDLTEVASTEINQLLTFYMMLPPVDMSGKTVYVTLKDNKNQVYQSQLSSRNMQAGYAYSFAATLVDVTVSSTITSPNFGESDNNI